MFILLSLPLAFLSLALRLYFILPLKHLPKSPLLPQKNTCNLAIFLGSGGHTSEMLQLLSALNLKQYAPRTYYLSAGDTLSASKAADFERKLPSTVDYEVVSLPRARNVHQSWLTTPLSAAISLASCLYHVTLKPLLKRGSFADVLLINGPGTCFVLCLAVYVNKFFGLPSPRILYIESFARVNSLSLSGKLLRPLVDRFIVQWPQAISDGGRGECRGWLV